MRMFTLRSSHFNLAVKQTWLFLTSRTTKMEYFPRVQSMINRLREVLKCQKCLQFKEEDSMVFHLSCDHFFCDDCLGDSKKCYVCDDSFSKPFRVSEDKDILSLYRSLAKFELPSKEDALKIYNNHKTLKENKNVTTGEEEVKDTPKRQRGRPKSKSKDKENEKMVVEEVDKVTPKPTTSKNETPVSAKRFKSSTSVKKDAVNSTPVNTSATKVSTSVNTSATKVSTPVNTSATKVSTSVNTSATKVSTPVNTSAIKVSTPASKSSSKGNSSFTKGNINKKNPKGETKLHLACKKSDFTAIKELIAAGANPNAQDNAGWTPLHESVFSGNLEVIKFLLDHGAKVNAPGLENTTALHEAIAKGNLDMIKLLLEYGADVSARNMFKETPLDLVTKYNLTEVEKILREAATKVKNVNVQPEFVSTDEEIIIYAHGLSVEDEKLVNKFVEKFNVKLISQITVKNTPTHIVVQKNNFDITWSIISCVPSGCWVVCVNWIKESLKNSLIKPYYEFEAFNPQIYGFSKARENKENLLPGLFSGCHFFFGGKFDSYSFKNLTINKESLKALVEKQGGMMCKRCPDPERSVAEKTVPYHANSKSSISETCFYIIYQTDKWDPNPKYNMSHMKTLPVDWVVSCLCKFELVDPKDKGSICDFLL